MIHRSAAPPGLLQAFQGQDQSLLASTLLHEDKYAAALRMVLATKSSLATSDAVYTLLSRWLEHEPLSPVYKAALQFVPEIVVQIAYGGERRKGLCA